MIEVAEEKNKEAIKDLEFVICTNLAAIDEE
jgi:hypothetical protein